MRLFIGIPLAEPVVDELRALCIRFGPHSDGLRWTARESWHITLQFLGNAEPGQFDCLTVRLSDVRSAAVPVQLGGLGIFDRAGVFLVKVELTPALTTLRRQVSEATARCGFLAEDQPYQPHITLARSKGDHGRQQLRALRTQAPAFPEFTAREFLLYESRPGPGGSKYEVRQRFPMTAG